MKFSADTVKAIIKLKRICNNNFIFNNEKSGKIIIRDAAKTIIGIYHLPDDEKEIPEFCIYDLDDFSKVLALFDFEKDSYLKMKFEEKHLVFQNKTMNIKYFFASKEFIKIKPPTKQMKKMDADIKFELSKENMSKILKMSLTFGGDIKIQVRGGIILAVVYDSEGSIDNSLKLILGKTNTDLENDYYFYIENFEYIPVGAYDVEVGPLGKFSSKDVKGLEYYITQRRK